MVVMLRALELRPTHRLQQAHVLGHAPVDGPAEAELGAEDVVVICWGEDALAWLLCGMAC